MMDIINGYLSTSYEDGARGPRQFDCWGLVRDARHRIYGKPLLTSWGHVRNHMLDEFTDAYKTEVASFSPCRPEPAAIACAFRTALLHHVGLVVDVDGRLMVLDIRRKKGAGLSPIGDFERRYQRVEYYRDAEQ